MTTQCTAWSPRCQRALETACDEAVSLTSSSSADAASDTPMSAAHLRHWVLAMSLCTASEPAEAGEEAARHALCLTWTNAVLSWAVSRLTKAAPPASGDASAGSPDLAVRPDEAARYQAVLLPRARVVLARLTASFDTWELLSTRLHALEASCPIAHADKEVSAMEEGEDGSRVSQAATRTADSLIGAALLLANRDRLQPTWSPAAAEDYETAVAHRLTHQPQASLDAGAPVHSTSLASVTAWHAARCAASSSSPLPATLPAQLSQCVDTIAYMMCHKIQNGTVTKCYAPVPFLLDAVALTFANSDSVTAGLAHAVDGEYRFASPAMRCLQAAVRTLYELHISAVLRDFKKRSKSMAPVQSASGAKMTQPTFELIVLVIEPTMDVLRREHGSPQDDSAGCGTIAAVRRSFALVFKKLLRDWLGNVTRKLGAKSSPSVAKSLEAERAKWFQWMSADLPDISAPTEGV